MIDQSQDRSVPSLRPTTPSESTITPDRGRSMTTPNRSMSPPPPCSRVSRCAPSVTGTTWRAGWGGSIGAVFVGELAPRAVVDAVAQDAAVGRGVVEDLELADAGAGRAVGARLDPQPRALAAARDADADDAERLHVTARAADGRLPVTLAAVVHAALVVVTGRRATGGDQAAAGVAEALLPGHAQPLGHRVAGRVRVAEKQHERAAVRIAALGGGEARVEPVERAGRRVEIPGRARDLGRHGDDAFRAARRGAIAARARRCPGATVPPCRARRRS